MKSFTIAAAIAGFASSVAAHGLISSPTPRKAGAGLKAACGDQVFNTQNSDPYGNVQGSIQNLQGSHPDCKIWQCKGVPFADKTEVFQYTAGQKIDMKIEIHAPHDGSANVSVVSTSTDKIIGKPLISWDKYALTSVPMAQHPEWTSFSITMPDVSTECAKAGDCVIQWWWDAPTINQSYEACIDFTMGGGSDSGSSPSTPANSTAPIPAEPIASPAASPSLALVPTLVPTLAPALAPASPGPSPSTPSLTGSAPTPAQAPPRRSAA
ncbi:hypothetical protein CFE70_007988 [Pyrenophora teres f. teres 0-1]